MRQDGRSNTSTRQISITTDFMLHANGSALIKFGNTKVICTATVEERVPPFLKGSGRGWITSEYSMLPASTHVRKARESSRGQVEGRTQEIQRLIGRALRSVVNLDLLGERTIWIDCDVIQADGGTRTAAITGGFIALVSCINSMMARGLIKESPINNYIAAVSVGIYNGEEMLDLCYEEDSNAEVDMNIVMTDSNEFIELQGTAEGAPFSDESLKKLIAIGQAGIVGIIGIQKETLGDMNKLVMKWE
ncbi:MAG TPA: ribonuclease PH [Bacillota bacterium]|nr:ribonuclease PH [Bacillota bacterium]